MKVWKTFKSWWSISMWKKKRHFLNFSSLKHSEHTFITTAMSFMRKWVQTSCSGCLEEACCTTVNVRSLPNCIWRNTLCWTGVKAIDSLLNSTMHCWHKIQLYITAAWHHLRTKRQDRAFKWSLVRLIQPLWYRYQYWHRTDLCGIWRKWEGR